MRSTHPIPVLMAAAVAISGCAGKPLPGPMPVEPGAEPAPPPAPPPFMPPPPPPPTPAGGRAKPLSQEVLPSPVEVFPHVRVLAGEQVPAAERYVEFDARTSPMLVADPRAPLFFLEALACLTDTREHESLIVSDALPSQIHAAMLVIGLTPGSPGGWKFENDRLSPVDPTGSRVRVSFTYTLPDGTPRTIDPLEWITNVRDGRGVAATLAGREPGRSAPGWVFSGSRLVQQKDRASGLTRQVYDADKSGTVIGLTSFGTELISFSRTISPDAATSEPEWIAKLDTDASKDPSALPVIPPPGTPVRVRIRAE